MTAWPRASATLARAPAVHDTDAYRVVIHNGVVAPEASEFPDLDGIEIRAFADLDEVEAQRLAERLDATLDPDRDPLSRLNAARLEDGLLVRLGANRVLDKPLYVICCTGGGAPGSAYPRILVEAGENSQMTLVEEHLVQGEAAAFWRTP